MCLSPCYPSLYFTGKGPRTKSSAPLHGVARKRSRTDARAETMDFDEDAQRYIPRSVRAQKAKEAQRQAAEHAKFLAAKHKREEIYDTLESVLTLSLEDFREMRMRKMYDLPTTSEDPFYPRNEMRLLKEEIYDQLSEKNKVCLQHPLDMEFLCSDEYFAEAVRVAKQLGLEKLMVIQQDYDIQIIHQFFATVVDRKSVV